MLWIHGGCYVSGSASDLEYNATSLAATTDVVVVSVQYRLGVFGFLGSPDMRSRDPQGSTGNYGLMDNIAALRWVQSNIAAFGGDPSRVTIFGESSGRGGSTEASDVMACWTETLKRTPSVAASPWLARCGLGKPVDGGGGAHVWVQAR